jgi:DNA-binding response OmpR family regulator
MKKLLFVEDDLNLSSIVKENLEDLGYKVYHVLTGEEALDSLKEERYDLILMDIELPGELDGFETAEAIRRVYPILPIIFATGRKSGEDLERGFRIKNMDYIRKPYGIKEITYRIEGLIGYVKPRNSPQKIGIFTFEPALRRLCGNGKEIHLSNLESELLLLLAENSDNVVCKDKIIQGLWGSINDQKSKESSLHNLIYILRKHLKEDPSLHLEVMSKNGYRITILPSSEKIL